MLHDEVCTRCIAEAQEEFNLWDKHGMAMIAFAKQICNENTSLRVMFSGYSMASYPTETSEVRCSSMIRFDRLCTGATRALMGEVSDRARWRYIYGPALEWSIRQ